MDQERGWRNWPLLFQPRALQHGWQGVAFTVLCVLCLVLVGIGDVSTGVTRSIGAFEVIPIIAAGWLLSDRSLLVVATTAVVTVIAVWMAGGESPVTAVVLTAIVPFLALVSRTAAVAVVAAHESGARDRLVSRVARIAGSAASLEEILEQVLGEIASGGLRGGAIALIDERNRLYVAAASGELDPAVWAARLPVGEGVMGRAAAERRTILINDLDGPDAPPSPTRSVGSNAQIRSLVAVPLMAAGHAIGVLEADSGQTGRFTEADVAVLEQIAIAISGVVQRAGALRLADERLRSRVRELTILLDAAQGLAASLDLDVIVATVSRSAADIVLQTSERGRRASVIRVNGDMATVVGDYDETGTTLAGATFTLSDYPGVARVIRSGTTAAVTADELESRFPDRRQPVDVTGAAYAPIRVGRAPWGVLSVSSRADTGFPDADLRLLQGIADLTGLAIANAELLEFERLRGEQLREHAERMADLDHVKSEFLRLASHELRGPLAVIKGYISLLADGSFGRLPLNAEQVMPVLAEKVREMNVLIDQMLETARLEDSRLQLTREKADLRDVVRSAVDSIAPAARQLHTIELNLPDIPVQVVVDTARVATIVGNLLDNAIKYSPDGGKVWCDVSLVDSEAVVDVRDQGLGISAEDVPRLFTRFGRIVTSANSHIPGTGLGLYLARELARLHGGDITVTSEPSRGSRFRLTLPAAVASPASATA